MSRGRSGRAIATERPIRAPTSRRGSLHRRRPQSGVSRSPHPRPRSRRDWCIVWRPGTGSSPWSGSSFTATDAKSGSPTHSPPAWRGAARRLTGLLLTRICASNASSGCPRARSCSQGGSAICSWRSRATPRSPSTESRSAFRASPSCRTLAWKMGPTEDSSCASTATRPCPGSWPRASCDAATYCTRSGRPRRRVNCSNGCRSNERSRARRRSTSSPPSCRSSSARSRSWSRRSGYLARPPTLVRASRWTCPTRGTPCRSCRRSCTATPSWPASMGLRSSPSETWCRRAVQAKSARSSAACVTS